MATLVNKMNRDVKVIIPNMREFRVFYSDNEGLTMFFKRDWKKEKTTKQEEQVWSEEDERMLSRCVKSIETSKQFADSATFRRAKDNEIDWLENRIKSFRPVKQEWSKEDKNRLEEAIKVIEANGCWVRSDDAVKQVSDFLKSLPERFNLQPKEECSEVELEFRGEKVKVKRPFFRDDKGRGYSTTEQDEEVAWNALRAWCEKKGISLYDLYPKVEWSEEDEEMRNLIIEALDDNSHYFPFKETKMKMIDWFKSLRPQYHGDVTMTEAYKMGKEAGKASSWKPSEEQMETLHTAVYLHEMEFYGGLKDKLRELYEQIKKLK